VAVAFFLDHDPKKVQATTMNVDFDGGTAAKAHKPHTAQT
jgi:hypothetical protein